MQHRSCVTMQQQSKESCDADGLEPPQEPLTLHPFFLSLKNFSSALFPKGSAKVGGAIFSTKCFFIFFLQNLFTPPTAAQKTEGKTKAKKLHSKTCFKQFLFRMLFTFEEKRLMQKILLIAICLSFACCSLESSVHTAELKKMEDSLFKAFPTVNRVSIEIQEGFQKKIQITLGDAELFNAPEQQQMEAARQTGNMVLSVFGDRTPSKGEVILVEEETTITGADAEKKIFDMHLKELKEATEKK